jgi:hypothetical protein
MRRAPSLLRDARTHRALEAMDNAPLHVRANALPSACLPRPAGAASTPTSAAPGGPPLSEHCAPGTRERHDVVIGGGAARPTGHRVVVLVDPAAVQLRLAALLGTPVAEMMGGSGARRPRLTRLLESLLDMMRAGRPAGLDLRDVELTATAAARMTVDTDGLIVALPDARGLLLQPPPAPDEVWTAPSLDAGATSDDDPTGHDDSAGRDDSAATASQGLGAWVAGMPRASGSGRADRLIDSIRTLHLWGNDYRWTRRGLVALMVVAPALTAFGIWVVTQLIAGN